MTSVAVKHAEPFGFALCCGAPPDILWDHGNTAICRKCNNSVRVAGPHSFLRHHWNAAHTGKRPDFNDRAGIDTVKYPALSNLGGKNWYSVKLNIGFVSIGHTHEQDTGCGDYLLQADRDLLSLLLADGEYECGIDSSRYLAPFKLASSPSNILECDWPKPKRYPYSYAYVTRWSCSDGTWGLNLTMRVGHARYKPGISKWLSTALEEDCEY